MKIIASTEIWNRTAGKHAGKKVSKAVVRTKDGRFVGATNQTREIPVAKTVRPRVTIAGR